MLASGDCLLVFISVRRERFEPLELVCGRARTCFLYSTRPHLYTAPRFRVCLSITLARTGYFIFDTLFASEMTQCE